MSSVTINRLLPDTENILLILLDNIVWPLLVLVFIFFSILIPDSFLTVESVTFLLFSSAALSLITFGEAICLLSGHFDLSVGSIAGFSAMFSALFLAEWVPNAPGIIGIGVILFIGSTIGFLNGISIVRFQINPFLQTLSFLIIFQGATRVLSPVAVTDLPQIYLDIGGTNVAILLSVSIFLLLWIILNYTKTGLNIYSVGGDINSAEDAGIKTDRIVILVYVISGTLSAIGGLLYTGFLGSATPSIGANALFSAFAAAIIGGISLFGGRGSLIGALGGVLLLGTIDAGLVQLGVQGSITQTVRGLSLLAAILIYTRVEFYRRKVLSLGK